ncbi:MAG: hypothetical protein J0M13_21170, partial [Candidatus Accumulibacter sp.]|nr:hypothetical protein [Candidatus Accumulibacter necessarius]
VALLPVLVCRMNMPTIVQQKQGDRPKRHTIMALQNAREIHHHENQRLRIKTRLKSRKYAYGVLTTG